MSLNRLQAPGSGLRAPSLSACHAVTSPYSQPECKLTQGPDMPMAILARRVWRTARGAAIALALAAAGPGTAAAQPAAATRAQGRFDVSIGGLWNGGYALDQRSATETRNQVGGGEFVLFETDSEVTGGSGLEARLGVRVGSMFTVEAGASWTRASVVSRVRADFEGAPGVEARSDFTQYVIDGALVARLERLAMGGGRVVPFVEAGAGYLRQLHEGQVLVETGSVFHGGGGVLVWLRTGPGGWVDRIGLRVDARITSRSGGIDVTDDRRRVFPALTAGLALGF